MTTTSHLYVVSKISVIVQEEGSSEAQVFHHKLTVPSLPKFPAASLVQPAIGPAATVAAVFVTIHISITSPKAAFAGLFTTGDAVAVVKSVSLASLYATAI